MRIRFVEISNFRKLKATHLDFDKKTTILVGANNSGKTSAMVALRIFLLSPSRLALRDMTIANWTKFDLLGEQWEADADRQSILTRSFPHSMSGSTCRSARSSTSSTYCRRWIGSAVCSVCD